MKNRKRFLFFLTAHPLQILLEIWGIQILFLYAMQRVGSSASPFSLTNTLFIMCGTCGMWAVVRTRLPEGKVQRHLLFEGAVGLGVSAVMGGGAYLAAALFRWHAIWAYTNLGTFFNVLVLLLTGPGYLVARLGVRLWLWWNRVRRRRMLWGLTHAHLVVVALAVVIGALVLFLVAYLRQPGALFPERPGDPFVLLLDELVRRVFPAAAVVIFFVLAALFAMLPPSALFSYLVARRTTQRLERLTEATSALRRGDYDARVEVVGEDEVAQLQADFNAMAEELEQTLHALETERDKVARLLEARRELVATVSHELRTPVATVRGYLDSLQEGWEEDAPPTTLHHDLAIMEQEMTRLQALIEDLFTLARAEVQGLTLEVGETDVGEIVRRRVDAFAPLAWNRERVEVVAELPPELPPALADPGRLEQVLTNLLRNALRHTPPGGIVAVVARAEEESLCLEVCDTGEGIAPEELPHIWERFYRGEKARSRDARGAGLGLALVKELTEAMGGTVDVESTPGQGSCFRVRLRRRE
jgi:signal transduction histidine kinase